MSNHIKIIIKRGEILMIVNEEITHRLNPDVIEVDVPMDFPTCSITEIVAIQTLAETWLREVKK